MPTLDRFKDIALMNLPFVGAISVTPSDTVDLEEMPRGIYIGTAGNLSVVLANGQTVLLTALAAGVIHPIRVTRVNAAGTTASGILAFY